MPYITETEDKARINEVVKLSDQLAARDALLDKAIAALETFGTVGRLIDRYMSEMPDGAAFKSGCAWQKDNVQKTLTWSDFRLARTTLDELKEARK